MSLHTQSPTCRASCITCSSVSQYISKQELASTPNIRINEIKTTNFWKKKRHSDKEKSCPISCYQKLALCHFSPSCHWHTFFCFSPILRTVCRRPCWQSGGNTVCPIKLHDYNVFPCFTFLQASSREITVCGYTSNKPLNQQWPETAMTGLPVAHKL